MNYLLIYLLINAIIVIGILLRHAEEFDLFSIFSFTASLFLTPLILFVISAIYVKIDDYILKKRVYK